MLRLVLALAFAAFTGSAGLAADTPKSLLDGIYAKYVVPPGKPARLAAKGVRLDNPAELNAAFTPALVALINADRKAAAAKKEAPNLDDDPFVNAQDWQISDVKIVVTVIEGDKSRATAVAMFQNFGKPIEVDFNLLKVKAGWRIDDVKWAEGSLRAILKR